MSLPPVNSRLLQGQRLGDAVQGFGMADDQITAVLQTRDEVADDAPFGWDVKVDEHIAQKNHVEIPRLSHSVHIQIQLLETHMLADLLVNHEIALLAAVPLQTIFPQVFARDLFRLRHAITTYLRLIQNGAADVGTEYF